MKHTLSVWQQIRIALAKPTVLCVLAAIAFADLFYIASLDNVSVRGRRSGSFVSAVFFGNARAVCWQPQLVLIDEGGRSIRVQSPGDPLGEDDTVIDFVMVTRWDTEYGFYAPT